MKGHATVASQWLRDRSRLFAKNVANDVVFLLTLAIDMLEAVLAAVLVTIIVATFGWAMYKIFLLVWGVLISVFTRFLVVTNVVTVVFETINFI